MCVEFHHNKIQSVTSVAKRKTCIYIFPAHNCVAFLLANFLRAIRRSAPRAKFRELDASTVELCNFAGHYLLVNEKPIMPNSCDEDQRGASLSPQLESDFNQWVKGAAVAISFSLTSALYQVMCASKHVYKCNQRLINSNF